MRKTVVIELLRKYFSTQPVLKAWLFGSFSRGEETQDSDVDIIVSLDKSKPIWYQRELCCLSLKSLQNEIKS